MSVVLVIGCGRSGTTLLMELLNRVPGLCFRGETNFLVPRLMAEVWEERFWLFFEWMARHRAPTTRPSSEDPKYKIPSEMLEAARCRSASGIQKLIRDILQIPDSARHWGFKEVWNGGTSFCVPWEPYDLVFPNAHWIGIVRNPFHFARSCAQWNQQLFDLNYLRARLFDWIKILAYSRSRAQSVPYREIRFEDMIARPQETIKYALSGTKLGEDLGTLEITSPVFASQGTVDAQKLSAVNLELLRQRIYLEFPTLQATMLSLGYDSPDDVLSNIRVSERELEEPIREYAPSSVAYVPQPSMPLVRENIALKEELTTAKLRVRLLAQRLFREHDGLTLLPSFEFSGGHCYLAKIPEFAPFSDAANHQLSFFQLYEDDRPIGIPNALHSDIECVGKGRFSHWGDYIRFSTSDNSDPNTNGRRYALKIEL